MASTNSDSRNIRQYKVPTSVFMRVFDLNRLEFTGSDQMGWREFYAQLETFGSVTRSTKVNKKTINIMARHSRRKGQNWCPTSFNFVAKMPIDRKSSEVIFRLLTCNLDKCDCRKLDFHCTKICLFHVCHFKGLAKEYNHLGRCFCRTLTRKNSWTRTFNSIPLSLTTRPATTLELGQQFLQVILASFLATTLTSKYLAIFSFRLLSCCVITVPVKNRAAANQRTWIPVAVSATAFMFCAEKNVAARHVQLLTLVEIKS